MALDVASLGLEVNSTDVDKGTAALDRFEASARKAGMTTEQINDAVKRANASITGAATGTDQLARRTDALIGSVDKEYAATMRMIEAHATLSAAVSERIISQQLMDRTLATMAGTAEKSTLSFSTLGRELRAMIDEALSGRWQNFQGTAARLFGTIAQAQPGLAAAAVGFGAFAAPLALATASVVAFDNSMRSLDIALKASGDSTGLSRKGLEDLAHTLSATTTLSVASARDIEGSFARAGASGAVFETMSKTVDDVAAGMGVKLPEAVKLFEKALQAPLATAIDLDKTLNLFTADQLHTIEVLEKTGHSMEAANIVASTLGERMKGLAAEAQGFSAAWDNAVKFVSNAFQTWGALFDGLAKSINNSKGAIHDWLDDFSKTSREALTQFADFNNKLFGFTQPSAADRSSSLAAVQSRLDQAQRNLLEAEASTQAAPAGVQKDYAQQGEEIIRQRVNELIREEARLLAQVRDAEDAAAKSTQEAATKAEEGLNRQRDAATKAFEAANELLAPTQKQIEINEGIRKTIDELVAAYGSQSDAAKTLLEYQDRLANQAKELLSPSQKLAQQFEDNAKVMALPPSERAAATAGIAAYHTLNQAGETLEGVKSGVSSAIGIAQTNQAAQVRDALDQAKVQADIQHRVLQVEIGDRDVLRAKLEAEAAMRRTTNDGVAIATAGTTAETKALEARSAAGDDYIKQQAQQAEINAAVFGAELRDRDELRARLEAELQARQKGWSVEQQQTAGRQAANEVIQRQNAAAKDNVDAIEREIASAGRLGEAYRTSSEAVALVTAQEAAHEAFLKNLTNDESAYTDTLLKRAAAQSSLKVDQSIAAMHDQESAMKGVAAAQLVGAAAAQKLMDANKQDLEFEKEAAPIRAQLIKAQLDDNKTLMADAQARLDDLLAKQDQLKKGRDAATFEAQTGALNAEIKAAKDANELLQKEVDLAGELPDVRAREVAQLRLKQELESKFGPGHEAEKQQLLANLDVQMKLTAEIEKMRAAREQVQQPFLDAVGSIKDAFVGLFEGIFSGGVDTFKKFGETVKNIFIHLAAQIAELMVIQPILNSVVGGITGVAPGFTNPLMMAQMIGGGGFNAGQFGVSGAGAGVQGAGGLFYGGGSALGGIGATGDLGGYGGTAFGGAGSALGGVDPSMASAAGLGTAGMFGGSLMGIIGGGALGFGAGSALGGGTLTGDIGAGGGALAGAALGSFLFPGVGTLLGGLLGGLAGGGLGGMFGPGPTSASSGFNLDTSGAQIGFSSKGTANIAAAQSLSTSLSGLIQQINQLTGGGHLAGGYHLGGDVSTAGPRTYIAGDDASWQFFTGPNAAKDAANRVLQLLAGSADKLTETVAHHSTVDTLQANIQFLNDVYKPLIAGKDAATGMTKAVQDLTKQFTDAKTAAAGLGLSVDGLNDALTKAIAKMRTDFDKDISQQILEIKDPLAASLAKLDDWKKQALEDAAAVGGNIVNIEELYGLKRQQIIDQQNQVITNSVSTMKDTIQSMLDALTGAGPGSLLSPAEKYAAGKTAFEAAAKQGTEEGTLPKDFAAITSQFLDASKAMFATTAAFAADQKEVTDVLQQLLGLPHAATGGYVSGVTIVGERGPEVVDFRGGAHVTASGQGGANDNGDVVNAITALHRTTQDYTSRLGQIADAQTRLTKRFDLLASGMATPGGRSMFQRRASP